MPKTHVTRRQIINAPIEAVYKAIANLQEWEAWSPWLIMEPEAIVTVAEDKRSYSWKGARVGEGKMAIISTVPNQSARYDLNFLTPFKSYASVGMDIKPMDGGTEVTWSLDSSLPFFMFWMKNMMQTFIGMDYERGLRLLKDYVEDGEVHSKLNFIGESDYAGCDYVGIERHCTIDAMPNHMGEDFERLGDWAKQTKFDPSHMFSIYHKFDPIKGNCYYTVAVPVSEESVSCPDDFICGSQPPARIYTLEHVGPYAHLGNAWSTLQGMIRGKEIKPIKNYHPFEIYANSPNETAPNDLITRINFAVKS